MNRTTKLTLATSIALGALTLGCQNVPDKDVEGGVLSGNEFSTDRATRGTTLDHSIVGTGGGSEINSPQAGGPTAAGGTVVSGGGMTKSANSAIANPPGSTTNQTAPLTVPAGAGTPPSAGPGVSPAEGAAAGTGTVAPAPGTPAAPTTPAAPAAPAPAQ